MEASLFVEYVIRTAQKESEALNQETSEDHIFLVLLETCKLDPKDLTDNPEEQSCVEKEIETVYSMIKYYINVNDLRGSLDEVLYRFVDFLHYLDRYDYCEENMLDSFFRRAGKYAINLGRDSMDGVILLDFIMDNPTGLISQFVATYKGLRTPETSKRENKGEDVSGKNGICNDSGTDEAFINPEDDKLPWDTGYVDEDDTDEILEENENPVESLAESGRKIKAMQKRLLEKVKGQDEAVYAFLNGLSASLIFPPGSEDEKKSPRGIFVFAGPPGVGKTYLAELAAEELNLPVMRLDMSEYVTPHSVEDLCGYDSVYKYAKPGILTGFVNENPSCVLIFDEIEKACQEVINAFLQILDAGRMTDRFLRETISFSKTYIIFTTNAGRSLYENDDAEHVSVSKEVLLETLRTEKMPGSNLPAFPAAICSRMATGYPVLFNNLYASELCDISRQEFDRLSAMYENRYKVKVQVDPLIPPVLLLRCGGDTDARSLRAETESFFKEETFKMIDEIGTDRFAEKMADLSLIRFVVEDETGLTFMNNSDKSRKPEVLVVGSDEVYTLCDHTLGEYYNIHGEAAFEDASRLLRDHEFLFALLELPDKPQEIPDMSLSISLSRTVKGMSGTPATAQYLQGLTRFMDYASDIAGKMPIYLLNLAKNGTPDEYLISQLIRLGARRVITAGAEENFELLKLKDLAEQLSLQAEADVFARERKKLTFQTVPAFDDDGKTFSIRIRGFEVTQRVSSEDSDFVLADASIPDISFDEVIGNDEAKRALKECAEFLKHPEKRRESGAKLPKGILLYGAPGTGKTLMARAMAHEAGVPFIHVNGSDFVGIYTGSGPENVRNLFKRARRYAPSIIFIDEIDAIGKSRTGSNQAAEETLNSLLTEMDGFRQDEKRPVFVMAATNFSIDQSRGGSAALDPALVRRFDRRIEIYLPGSDDRKKYLESLLGKDTNVSTDGLINIVKRSVGMTLADLKNVMNLAENLAWNEGGVIDDIILSEALERFQYGEPRAWDDEYLLRVAVHEAGHALIDYLNGRIPRYITIVARAYYGGYVLPAENENKPGMTKTDILDMIDCSLAGRAAEIVWYGPQGGLHSGASDDLYKATLYAFRYVCEFGMDEREGIASFNYSSMEEMGPEEKQRVRFILDDELSKTEARLMYYRDLLIRMVDALMEKNALTENEIEALMEGDGNESGGSDN